ncbi:MAG: sn-glycerol-1-phosphate dehydrogenase [Lachnospiraceae bacterium]|nr:sn-glycerol-1-phosphate dehydrogenase [Lachnospiraceae bacterium]
MNINELLEGVECTCGRHHTCSIQSVYIEKDAIKHLTGICNGYQNVLLVADENTFAAAGEAAVTALMAQATPISQDTAHGYRTVSGGRAKTIRKVIFPGSIILVPNEAAIETVTTQLNGIDFIVGVGSGVIQDLCKYVSHYNKIPYAIVATAPSMDGYASDGAAMITDGMKVTYPAGLPVAIVADTTVLANAPMEMLKAGYGDIIGKFSALNDWKLSHLMIGEYFCQYIYDITMAQIQKTIHLAEGILKRDEESVKTLTEALVVIGVMMSFAGSSRPASGSEHHLSHFFEITGLLHGQDYFPHGIDVAYGTVITAEIREKLATQQLPEQVYRPNQEAYLSKMEEIYKTSAAGCITLQEKVGRYQDTDMQKYRRKETSMRTILAEMPSAEEIKHLLSLVALDINEFYDLYGTDKINDAVLYAKELKDRYSVLWINYDFNGGEK